MIKKSLWIEDLKDRDLQLMKRKNKEQCIERSSYQRFSRAVSDKPTNYLVG